MKFVYIQCNNDERNILFVILSIRYHERTAVVYVVPSTDYLS